jgi:hypothetical protein
MTYLSCAEGPPDIERLMQLREAQEEDYITQREAEELAHLEQVCMRVRVTNPLTHIQNHTHVTQKHTHT